MSEYGYMPTEALLRYAAHSNEQVKYWEGAKREADEAQERATRMLAHWTEQRDEQFHALDERDEMAPGSEPTDSGTT